MGWILLASAFGLRRGLCMRDILTVLLTRLELYFTRGSNYFVSRLFTIMKLSDAPAALRVMPVKFKLVLTLSFPSRFT